MANQLNKVYAGGGNLQTRNSHGHVNRSNPIRKPKMRCRRAMNQVASLAARELDGKWHCPTTAGQLSKEKKVVKLVGETFWGERVEDSAKVNLAIWSALNTSAN